MTTFWPTFLGGVASGVVILLVGSFVRRLIRERPEGGVWLKLNAKQLGPIIVVVVGGIIVVIAALTRQEGFDAMAAILMILGFVAKVVGASLMGPLR